MPAAPASRRRAGHATVAMAAAFAVAMAAAVLGAIGARQASATARVDDTRSEALAAARKVGVDFATYDYRTIATDFKRVADESTGRFHKQWLTQSTAAAQAIRKVKGISEQAEVVSAGITDSGPNRVSVAVAIDRIVKNEAAPKGQANSFGLQMVLVRTGDRWLASEVTPL